MAQSRAKRSEKGLLTPDNCVVAIIDLQPQMLFGVANFDRQTIINNNVALSKAAKVFDVPVVLSTVETKSFSGNMWPTRNAEPDVILMNGHIATQDERRSFAQAVAIRDGRFASVGSNEQVMALRGLTKLSEDSHAHEMQ